MAFPRGEKDPVIIISGMISSSHHLAIILIIHRKILFIIQKYRFPSEKSFESCLFERPKVSASRERKSKVDMMNSDHQILHFPIGVICFLFLTSKERIGTIINTFSRASSFFLEENESFSPAII